MKSAERDVSIDRLRALAIFWVLVVHVLYWGNFFDNRYVNVLKSFCLFEMPLMFFVTGAASRFDKTSGYFKFVLKRFKRILIPYWIFAFVCAVVVVIDVAIKGSLDFIYMVKIMISWLIPIDFQISTIPYLKSVVWFIPVYLCIVLLIPLLRKMQDSKYRIRFIACLVAVFIAMCAIKRAGLQKITFYTLWTYLGMFYNEYENPLQSGSFRRYGILTAAVCFVIIIISYFLGFSVDMQTNKFPPNVSFLIFSVAAMSLIFVLFPFINKTFDKIEHSRLSRQIIFLFATRSMTMFLYQVFPFGIAITFLNKVIPLRNIQAGVLKSFVCLLFVTAMCTGIAKLLGGLEDLGRGN